MSKTVDQRIVEMRFDNNQFEQNVKTSMGTLDRLKHALKLDGASKGLENVSKASKGLDFSSIAQNVQSLSDRFSTMGIVGMRVIERMTDACINFAQKGIGFVTSKIIEGGKRRAFNIENAHFQLQGLLKDEEKVQAVMADAMESVDGTAYAYDEAAKAASQFAASGLQAGEEMLGALRGITGVAAMTNSEYEGISRIFTTVAGNGRLMGDQLLQLSSRGLNAASSLADYFNGVKDGSIKATDEVSSAIKKLSKGAKTTEADIREMVSKGKISFKIFAAAMDDAFGEHAKKANETFTGAMSNVGAALARIGAKFVSPLIEQNGPFVKLFNTLRTNINAINKMMDPFADKFTHTVNEMANSLNKYLSSFKFTSSIEPTMKKLQRIFGHLSGIAKEVGNILFPFLKRTVDEFKMFGRVLNGDQVSTPLDRLGDALTHVHVVLGKLAYSISQNHTLMQNWRNTIRGVLAVFDILAQVIGAVFRVFGPTNAEIGNCAEGMLTLTGGVGEYLYSVDQWLRKTNAIEESLRNFKRYVTDAFNAFIDKIPGLRETLDALKETFSNISSSDIVTFLNNLEEAFGKLFDKIGSSDLKGMELVRYALVESKVALKEFFDMIVSGEHPAVKAFNSMWNKFHETWVKVEELLKHAKERFNKFLEGLDVEELGKNFFKAGSILYALYELRRLVNAKINVSNSLSDFLKQLKLSVMEWRKGSKWNVLIKIASAIAILAGSLYLISKIEPDNLMPAVRALGILGIYLVGFFEVLNGFEKLDSFGNVGNQIKGLYAVVIALAGMAYILVQVSKVPWDDLKNGLIGMGGMIAGVIILSYVIAKEGKGMSEAVPGLAMVIGVLAALVAALFFLQFIDFDKVGDGLVGMAALMVALYIFCKEIGKLKLDQIHIDPNTFASLIPLAAAMVILAIAVRMLSGLNPAELATGLIGIVVGIGALIAAVAALGEITKTADVDKLLGAAAAMMLVAIAMNMLLPAILILGAIPWPVMVRGMAATVVGIAALAGALWLTSKAGSSGQLLAAGAGMMMVAAAMNMLLPVILIFGTIPFKVIGKGIGIFLAALLGFTVVGVIANSAAVGLYALGSSLLMISASIAITGVGLALIAAGVMNLAIALGILSTIGQSALPGLVIMFKTFIAELLTILPDIMGAVAESFGRFISVILDQITILAPKIVGAFTAIISSLLDQITILAPKFAEAATAIILALIATFVSCVPALVEGIWISISMTLETLKTYVPIIVGTLFDLLILTINTLTEKTPAIVHAIAEFIKTIISAVLEEIKNIDTTVIVENLQAVGLMAALMAAFAGLALLTGPALAGVLGFGLVVSELSLVLAAFGKLSEIPGLTTLIGEGGNLLETIGTAIGKFVGGIVGGFADGVSSTLPKVGKDLTSFMENMDGFLSGCEKIKPDTLNAAKTLGDVIIALTLGSILDGITRFLGLGKSSLSKFGSELEEFGPHFAAFADSISGVQAGTVIASARAAEALATMANNLPNSGGALGLLVGNNDLAEFAKGLKPFGEAMAEYSEAVDGKINESAVAASARAGGIIADLASKLPNSGGALGLLVGNNDLAEFAKGLKKFGKSMAEYSEAVDGKINETAVASSARAAGMISDMASKLPNSGGALSGFIGDNTLSRFGKELSKFAPHYVDYAEKVTGVPAGVVIASAHCIETLANIANGLGNTGGLLQAFTGQKSLVDFGVNLESLGYSYSRYGKEISKTDSAKISESIERLKEFTNVAAQISGQASTGLTSLGTFITQAASIGKDLMTGLSNGVTEGAGSISKSIETVALTIIETAKKALGVHSPSTIFAEIGRYLIEGLANGIAKAKSVVVPAVKTLANTIITTVKTGLSREQFTNVASSQVVTGIVTGLNSNKERILSTIKTICDNVIQKFRTCLPNDTFKSIGSAVISAIITGMQNKKADLTAIVKDICNLIAAKFKESINGAQYREVGVSIIQSIVTGIQSVVNSNDSALANSVKTVSNTIINTFKSGLSQATFVSIGKNVAAGLEKGIKEGAGTAKKAAEETAKAVVEATKGALGVESPSTVAAEIGKYFDSGLAKGIIKYTSMVEGSSEEMADRLIKATQAACMAVNYILEHGLENGPVIKPVVDLSNADYALHELQNEFGNGLTARMASNVSLTTSTDSIKELANRLEAANSMGNTNIVGAIEELRGDVDRLNQSMSHLQVIMDSGTLVGSIAPMMDMQLGNIAKLKSRGV